MMLWMIYRDDDPLAMTDIPEADLDILLASLRKHFPTYVWDAESVETDGDGA